MEESLSVKNLVTRTERDPWNAVLGRRPDRYQIPQVGNTLIQQVDHALIERDLDRAFRSGIVFERWAQRLPHFHAKVPAVMASIYTACDLRDRALYKLQQAKRRVERQGCRECRAFYHHRSGRYLIYDHRPKESIREYNKAVALFEELDNPLETAKSLMGRGVAKYLLRLLEDGLADEERALDMIGTDSGIYIVVGSINASAILTSMGNNEAAREKIDHAQAMLKGMKNTERAKLIIRWIRSLLLERTGERADLKLAAQMMDRIAARMRHFEMKAELRVLLADRARVSRDPATTIRIASRAYELEESPRVMKKIERVIRSPTRENVVAWRKALDFYVPSFPASA